MFASQSIPWYPPCGMLNSFLFSCLCLLFAKVRYIDLNCYTECIRRYISQDSCQRYPAACHIICRETTHAIGKSGLEKIIFYFAVIFQTFRNNIFIILLSVFYHTLSSYSYFFITLLLFFCHLSVIMIKLVKFRYLRRLYMDIYSKEYINTTQKYYNKYIVENEPFMGPPQGYSS